MIKCDFPAPFCAVRWLINGPVAEAGLKILPKMKTFVKRVKNGDVDIAIDSASCKNVVEALDDKLLGCKFPFFCVYRSSTRAFHDNLSD